MENVKNLFELVSDELGSMATSDIAVGAPISVGQVTLVPISRVSVGFAAGGGTGEGTVDTRKQPRGRGTGVGSGGGGKVRPVAVIAFTQRGVEVLKVDETTGPLEKIFEKIPELIERFKPKCGAEGERGASDVSSQ